MITFGDVKCRESPLLLAYWHSAPLVASAARAGFELLEIVAPVQLEQRLRLHLVVRIQYEHDLDVAFASFIAQLVDLCLAQAVRWAAQCLAK